MVLRFFRGGGAQRERTLLRQNILSRVRRAPARANTQTHLCPEDTAFQNRQEYRRLPINDVDLDDIDHSDLYEPDHLSCYARWKDGEFTVEPGNVLLDVWDVLVILALLSMSVVLPYDVALIDKTPWSLQVFFRVIDTIFLCDILIAFNVAYAVTAATSRDMFEHAPLKIARHYTAVPFSDHGTAGWFWLDSITLIPWEFFGDRKYFRLVRVLRLTRMFRLVRVIKMVAKWHMHFGYPIALLNSISCMSCTLMTCHWLACAWAHLALHGEIGGQTWMQSWLNRHWEGKTVLDCSPAEVYNIALYWCLETLTSVGYGDLVPQTQLEVALVSCTMIMLGTLWAWMLAHMVSMLQNIDAFQTESNQLMDDLNLLMQHRDLHAGLRQRCRKHMYESFEVHRQHHQQRTVKWLSAGLQGEIAVESGVDKACSCIWYLRAIDKPVLIAIAQRFMGDVFSPNEYIHCRYAVSVIRKGSAIKRGRLLTRDDVIGEDMILATDYLVDIVSTKSLTFVEVMTLSRDDLVGVCERHADFDRRMRKAQIKLAVWRAFVTEAQALKRGRVSMVFRHSSSECPHLVGRRPGFSHCVGPVGLVRAFSPQESINSVVDQLSALRRRVEETQVAWVREFSALSTKVDELRDRAGLLKRRGLNMNFCGRGAN